MMVTVKVAVPPLLTEAETGEMLSQLMLSESTDAVMVTFPLQLPAALMVKLSVGTAGFVPWLAKKFNAGTEAAWSVHDGGA